MNFEEGIIEEVVWIKTEEDKDDVITVIDSPEGNETNLGTQYIMCNGGPPYVKREQNLLCCSVCDKTFTNRYCLTRHLRIHIDERVYECHTCEKRFNDKSNLIQHVRIHSGERRYLFYQVWNVQINIPCVGTLVMSAIWVLHTNPHWTHTKSPTPDWSRSSAHIVECRLLGGTQWENISEGNTVKIGKELEKKTTWLYIIKSKKNFLFQSFIHITDLNWQKILNFHNSFIPPNRPSSPNTHATVEK